MSMKKFILYHFSGKSLPGECRAFTRGLVEGVASPMYIWHVPVVTPPETLGIAGDWSNVGGYLSDALRKDKAKISEPA